MVIKRFLNGFNFIHLPLPFLEEGRPFDSAQGDGRTISKKFYKRYL